MRPTTTTFVFTVLLAGSAVGTPVSAQTLFRPYVGASFGSFKVSADEVTGSSPSPGILAGISVSRIVDVEFDLSFPTRTFVRSYTATTVSFAPSGSSRAEIERLGVLSQIDRQREVTANMSVVVIVRPPIGGRLVPGLVAGVTSQRIRESTAYTPVTIPPGVDPLHPSVVARDERSSRNIGAPTIGANLSIALTPHLHLVPDVRYDYGSIGDEINNAWRSSVRVIWRF